MVWIFLTLACVFANCMGREDRCERLPGVQAELMDEIQHAKLEVTGDLPLWLSGTLVRNGPINFTIDGKRNAHWFDGLAMLHSFTFREGELFYTNKFLRTEAYKKVFREGRLDYAGFATDPCRSLFARLLSFFFPHERFDLHNANVNVASFAEQAVALTEIPLPVRFDIETLNTLGVFDYEDELPKESVWESAHPHTDLRGHEIFNYLVAFGRVSHYELYRMAENRASRELIAKIEVDEPAYMHSFALTENYVVFSEFPLCVKPLDLMTKGKPFIQNYSWVPERGTQFIVVDRKSGQVVGRFKSAPFFAFHHANAFEREGELICDIVCYDDNTVISELAHLEDRLQRRLERFTLSLATGQISSSVLLRDSIEFPRINERYDGRPYRYLYLIDPREPLSQEDERKITKIDVESRELWSWSERGCYPGEAIFVPLPSSEKEDEGVVMSVIHDEKNRRSFLLILDGKDLKEIARAYCPHPIPEGLHGAYFDKKAPHKPL